MELRYVFRWVLRRNRPTLEVVMVAPQSQVDEFVRDYDGPERLHILTGDELHEDVFGFDTDYVEGAIVRPIYEFCVALLRQGRALPEGVHELFEEGQADAARMLHRR